MNRLLKYSILLFILLSACKHYYTPVQTIATHSELKDFKNDSVSIFFIAPFKKELDVKMNEVIAYCDSALTKDGTESSLANFVMNAVEYSVNKTNPELKKIIPTVNRGGLRINLPKGDISVRTIYELMPFDNEIVILKLNPAKLKEAVNYFCDNGKLFTNYLEFYCDKKNGINLKIHGEILNENSEYTIITTDFLANGGDNCTFFSNPLYYSNTGIKLRDAIIDYCRYLTNKNLHIVPFKNGRISVSR